MWILTISEEVVGVIGMKLVAFGEAKNAKLKQLQHGTNICIAAYFDTPDL